MVDRSQNGRSMDFRQDFVEYMGNNLYIPTSVNCSLKCINHPTSGVYTEGF